MTIPDRPIARRRGTTYRTPISAWDAVSKVPGWARPPARPRASNCGGRGVAFGHDHGVKRDGEAVTEQSLQDLVDQLDDVTARRLLADAAMRDEETGRAVRLAAAGPEERLEVLRVEVDSGLRTRRHLGYGEASEWAGEARPVVEALAEAVEVGRARELVEDRKSTSLECDHECASGIPSSTRKQKDSI